MSAESASEAQWADNNQSVWTPDAWHMSPAALQAHAAALNHADYAGAAAAAGKHSQPPCTPSSRRLM